MYAFCSFGQNYQTRIKAVVCYIATSINTSSLYLKLQSGRKEMRYCFVFYFLSNRKVDSVDRVYKEGSDRTLLGPIQSTAVH